MINQVTSMSNDNRSISSYVRVKPTKSPIPWLPSITEHSIHSSTEYLTPTTANTDVELKPITSAPSPRRLSLPGISNFVLPKFPNQTDDIHRKLSHPNPDYSNQAYLSGTSPVPCHAKGCQERFSTQEQLKNHMLVHSNQPSFIFSNFQRPPSYSVPQRHHHTSSLPSIYSKEFQYPPVHLHASNNLNLPHSYIEQTPQLHSNLVRNASIDASRRYSMPLLYSGQPGLSTYSIAPQQTQYPRPGISGQTPYSQHQIRHSISGPLPPEAPRLNSYGLETPGPGRPPKHKGWSKNTSLTVWEGLDNEGKPVKYFMCPVENCFMKFKRSEHLRRHQGVHTQERPFECPHSLCTKRFSRRDNLRQHLRIHDKAKRAPAPIMVSSKAANPVLKPNPNQKSGGDFP